MDEVRQEISECLAGEGIEVGTDAAAFEGISQEFEDELDKLDELIGPHPAEALTEEQLEALSDEEADELYSQKRDIPNEVKTTLAEIQEREIRIGTTVWDCGGSSTGKLTKTFLEVRAEYEQRFLDDYAAILDEYQAES